MDKLVLIEGDISEKRLALKNKEVLSNVSVIFHTAASVRFDEPLRVRLDKIKVKRRLSLIQTFPPLGSYFINGTRYQRPA